MREAGFGLVTIYDAVGLPAGNAAIPQRVRHVVSVAILQVYLTVATHRSAILGDFLIMQL